MRKIFLIFYFLTLKICFAKGDPFSFPWDSGIFSQPQPNQEDGYFDMEGTKL